MYTLRYVSYAYYFILVLWWGLGLILYYFVVENIGLNSQTEQQYALHVLWKSHLEIQTYYESHTTSRQSSTPMGNIKQDLQDYT